MMGLSLDIYVQFVLAPAGTTRYYARKCMTAEICFSTNFRITYSYLSCPVCVSCVSSARDRSVFVVRFEACDWITTYTL
jgi:hypothetical protein